MAFEIGRLNVGNGGHGDNQLIVRYDLINQNIAGNYSTIRAYLYFYAPVWISFDSANAYLHGTGWYNIPTSFGAGEHHIGTTEFNVGHNVSGEGSFAIGYGIDTSFLVSGNGITSAETLPTIPRAAKITKCTEFNDEENPTISISNPGNWNMEVWLEPNPPSNHIITRTLSNDAIAFTWDLTDEERQQLRESCTTSNQCTMRIGLYSKDQEFVDFKDVNFNIINANPVFNIANYVATNYLNLADNKTIIKGYSNIKVTLGRATALKGANIVAYKVACGTKLSQSESLLHTLNNVDDSIIKCYAIDTRGNTTEKIVNIEKFIGYTGVTLDTLSALRMLNESGTEVELSFSGKMWIGNFGKLTNSISAQYFYKELNSGSDWIQGTSMLEVIVSENYHLSVPIKGDLGALGFDKGKAYLIKVNVVDKLSSNERMSELTKFRGLMYFHEDGIAFGGEYDVRLFNDRKTILQFYNDYTDKNIALENFMIHTPNGVRTFDNQEIGFQYSTKEQWTGEYWVDGKKIYTKTFSANTSSKTITIDLSSLHMGDFWMIDHSHTYVIVGDGADTQHMPVNKITMATTTIWGIEMSILNDSQAVIVIGSGFQVTRYIFTLQYTKK